MNTLFFLLIIFYLIVSIESFESKGVYLLFKVKTQELTELASKLLSRNNLSFTKVNSNNHLDNIPNKSIYINLNNINNIADNSDIKELIVKLRLRSLKKTMNKALLIDLLHKINLSNQNILMINNYREEFHQLLINNILYNESESKDLINNNMLFIIDNEDSMNNFTWALNLINYFINNLNHRTYQASLYNIYIVILKQAFIDCSEERKQIILDFQASNPNLIEILIEEDSSFYIIKELYDNNYPYTIYSSDLEYFIGDDKDDDNNDALILYDKEFSNLEESILMLSILLSLIMTILALVWIVYIFKLDGYCSVMHKYIVSIFTGRLIITVSLATKLIMSKICKLVEIYIIIS